MALSLAPLPHYSAFRKRHVWLRPCPFLPPLQDLIASPRGDAHPLLCIYSENRSPGSRPLRVCRCCFDWPFGALECVKLCVLIGQSRETAFHLLFCGGDWPPGPAVPLQISWPSTSLRGNTTLTPDQSLWTFGSFPTKCLISDPRPPSFPLSSLQSLTCFSICIIQCDGHYNLACIL